MRSPAAASLAAILRHDPSALAPGVLDEALVAAAIQHGVAPLVYRALNEAGIVDRLAPEVAAGLKRLAREAVLIESIRADDLVELLHALAKAGIRPLLFKGAAIAASHYPTPAFRPRGDSDLLVRRDEVAVACRVLDVRGFVRTPRPSGTQVTQQARYTGQRAGAALAYDVHWRIADPHVFADLLPYEELERDAVSDSLTGTRRLGSAHALLVACIHRVAHHYDTEILLLLYDIDLLARGLTNDGWQQFIEMAETKRLRAVCLRGLRLAVSAFETPIPSNVAARLAVNREVEPTAAYVGGSLRRVDVLRSDFWHLPTWWARGQLIAGHLFPTRDYMRASGYHLDHEPLVSAYLRRISRGARHWFRPLT